MTVLTPSQRRQWKERVAATMLRTSCLTMKPRSRSMTRQTLQTLTATPCRWQRRGIRLDDIAHSDVRAVGAAARAPSVICECSGNELDSSCARRRAKWSEVEGAAVSAFRSISNEICGMHSNVPAGGDVHRTAMAGRAVARGRPANQRERCQRTRGCKTAVARRIAVASALHAER